MTNASVTTAQLEERLNQRTAAGQILAALDEYYAEDCVFQESDGSSRTGKAAQRAHLEAFFATLKGFNGATLHAQAVGEDGVGISEWTFDMRGPEGPIVWNEVLSRRWEGGRVVSERYYGA